ncbi:DoxX family protein [Corynebacterium ciconiae]|uniref:DoxX family protein n=1 Tax=Corynebacterium ciconiae TaxID=227319 RepID=UPI001FCAEC93|nr:hypothetical protein [Corynebacterium ciconiae]
MSCVKKFRSCLSSDSKPNSPLRSALWAGVFGFAGTMHFVHPHNFDEIVPEAIPGTKRQWTYASGVAELGLAGAIAATTIAPSLRPYQNKVVAPVAAAFLAAVWPANMKMAWDWRGEKPLKKAIAFARVPAQIPMINSARKLGS